MIKFKTSFCEFEVDFVRPKDGITLVKVGEGFPDIGKMSNDVFYQFIECCNIIEDEIPAGDSYMIRWPKQTGQKCAREIIAVSRGGRTKSPLDVSQLKQIS